MRIDRRLVLIGVMVIVLSMTMATQYATTRIGYKFAIVHPSDADIRFIASDNSSDGRVLRVENNGSTTQYLTIDLGSWSPGQTKNYTAVFGIVNEENFSVDITHINISGTNANYIDMWLHGNRSHNYPDEAGTKIMAVSGGAASYSSSSTMWTLGRGDGDPSTMNASAADISTPWDSNSHVRYSITDTYAINGTSDFVWIGMSLTIPTDAALSAESLGTIFVHFRATTHD